MYLTIYVLVRLINLPDGGEANSGEERAISDNRKKYDKSTSKAGDNTKQITHFSAIWLSAL